MKKNKKALLVITSILVASVIATLWYRRANSPKDLSSATSIGQNTKGEQEAENPEDEPPVNIEDNKNPKKDAGAAPVDELAVREPIGNFVSSHEVMVGSIIASSCVTTPGIQCTIQFTKEGVTKSLKAQLTDKEGATYWEWTPKQIGLTPGDWEIKAVATNGSDSKTSADAMPMKVE